MPVETVNYTLVVPKESKEVADAVGAIVEHFVQGKPLSEAAALLPAVLQAVDGWNKVGDEVKSQYVDEASGYLLHRVLGALKGKAPAVVPV